ncbi:hypothetical protein [Flexithrix dorotheae]|uniref:hypothetical protein n=1 Tax=Flexithrix dorotheae TaxID=70993 RepID=UPI000368B9EC|nr:hypothetical protein [Flexithrix dorotheae]
MLNRKVISKAKQFLTGNNRVKAIEYLLANGCNIQYANELLRKIAKTSIDENTDQLIIDELITLLPKQHTKAVKVLSEYYDLNETYAKGLIDKIIAKNDFTPPAIARTITEVQPVRKNDFKLNVCEPQTYYETRVLSFLINGREDACLDVLMNELKLEENEALDFLEELKMDIRRED